MPRQPLFLIVLLALTAGGIEAQSRDARVLRPGEVRLSAEAEYQRVDRRFTARGRERLAADYDGPLTPDRFPALEPLVGELSAFLEATGDVERAEPADPTLLQAGTLTADASWSTRYLPIRLGVGVLTRLEVGISLPIVRNERLPKRLDLADANIGVNPDPSGNLAILAELAPELGESPLLPLAGSPLGVELQRRVEGRTGSQLTLPTEPLHGAQLIEIYPGLPVGRGVSEWLPGDLEIDGRFRLLSSLGDAARPSAGATGLDHRLTLEGAVRLGTGAESTAWRGADHGPLTGASGFRVGAVGDLFWRERWWLGFGGSREWLAREEALIVVPSGSPWGPGESSAVTSRSYNSGEIWAAPRVLLTREVAVGGIARWEHLSGDGTPAEGSRTWLGAGLQYSTLPAYEDGGTRLPLEVDIGFMAATSGAAGLSAPSTGYLRVSLLQQLWGERR